MVEPKRIDPKTVPAALEKALRYRLLNEPLEAESICRDVLLVDPDNQAALVNLLLALTDQFEKEFTASLDRAKEVLPRLQGEFEQSYYAGIIHERWAKAQLTKGMPGEFVLSWIREAMRCYETAEKLSTPDDPEATLRWNTCVRFLDRHAGVKHQSEDLTHDVAAKFGDDVPLR